MPSQLWSYLSGGDPLSTEPNRTAPPHDPFSTAAVAVGAAGFCHAAQQRNRSTPSSAPQRPNRPPPPPTKREQTRASCRYTHYSYYSHLLLLPLPTVTYDCCSSSAIATAALAIAGVEITPCAGFRSLVAILPQRYYSSGTSISQQQH